MKSIRKWYAGFKLRDRFLTLGASLVVLLAISFQLGYDLITTALIVTGIMASIHFFLEKSNFPGPAIAMLLQTIALAIVFRAYAVLTKPLFENTSYIFSSLLLTISTLLIFTIAYKYSVGRLWLTLMLSFTGLNLIGPLLMDALSISNPLFGIAAGFVILAIRCVLWRDLFRNRKAEIPNGIKTDKNTESLKSLVLSMDNVKVQELDDDALDFRIDTPVNTYYVNAVTLRQRIVITNEDVASGIYNLKSTLFETARQAVRLNKATSRKVRKNPVVCIVNTTDKSNSKAAVNVSITGKTRDEGKDVIILSPSSLVHLIKKDTVKQ